MKKISLLLFIFTAISCSGKPQIKFKEVQHHFGNQKQNIELKYVFTFKNIGSSTLIIKKITAG